jgi:UDP-glucose 4-epimerase
MSKRSASVARRHHPSDLVDGLMRLMETPDDVSGPVNLGNPVEFTIRQLAETVIALTGSSSKIAYRPLPEDDPRQRCPDISLAQKLLAWAPRVQLRDGLMKTIKYFERLLRSDPRDERLPIRLATTHAEARGSRVRWFLQYVGHLDAQ